MDGGAPAIAEAEAKDKHHMQYRLPNVILSSILAVACGGSNKPAETPDNQSTGEKVDRAAQDAEDSAEKATERAGENLEEAGDKAKEKTKNEE